MNQPEPPNAGRRGGPPPTPPRRNPAPMGPPPPHQGPRGPYPPGQFPRGADRRPPVPQNPRPSGRPTPPAPDAADPTRRVAPPNRPRSDVYEPPKAYSGVPGYAPPQQPEPIPGRERPTRKPVPAQSRSASDAPPRKPRPDAPRPVAPKEPDRRKRALRRPRGTRRLTRRRVGTILLVLLLVVVITPVALMFYYDSTLHRVDALAPYAGKPASTPGTTWLIVGTDARSGLTEEQRKQLSTGDDSGARTDTMMLIYKPLSGKATIISIPRDLYVPIPGQGSHKINAAFNFGGPTLLIQTVEGLSGVHIDHYAEIGFGGFDTLVDAVGGVHMCIDTPLRDPKAGLNLKAGCQTLNGTQALGFVRTRAFADADLMRVQNQRKFLAALMAKATSPSVLLNPFRLFPFVNGTVDTLTVDNGTHIWDLGRLAWWLRSSPQTITTPNGGPVNTDDGSSLAVDDTTKQFFDALRRGQQIPQEYLNQPAG